MRARPKEVYAVIDWAYEGGCTPKEVQRILADFGVNLSYNMVYKHKPEFREHAAEYSRAYRKKKKNTWEDMKKDAQRYLITGAGGRLLYLGSLVGDDFASTTTLGVLAVLRNGETDDRTMVEGLRRRGIYGKACTRGIQLGPLRKALRRMEKNGLIRRI